MAGGFRSAVFGVRGRARETAVFGLRDDRHRRPVVRDELGAGGFDGADEEGRRDSNHSSDL